VDWRGPVVTMIDDLKEILADVEQAESKAVHKLGEVRGYAAALRDIIASLNADRPTKERGGKTVEMANRKPDTEKR